MKENVVAAPVLDEAVGTRRVSIHSSAIMAQGLSKVVNSRGGRNVVDVVAQGHEQIKEELAAPVEHLKLHGPAALEG